MAKVVERHTIDSTLSLFRQENSQYWYARFKVDEWYTKSTKAKVLDNAITRAVELRTEFKIMISNNLPVHTARKLKKHTFSKVADLAITRMTEDMTGNKNPAYNRYIGAIKNYLKPFFDNCVIRDIDTKKLQELDTWRIEKMKRVPAKDTVKDHNAGLQRVFDEAVIQKYITQTELPTLINNGRRSERRAAFTKEEYERIVIASKKWIKEVPQKRSQEIRQMLYFYIQIAAMSGLRPGTEMEALNWSDIDLKEGNDRIYLIITVRKGKTTKYTGTREVICKDALDPVIAEFIKGRICEPDEKVFDLDISRGVYGKNFTKLLKRLNLQTHAHGTRTLYSLRHSYITWEIEAGTSLPAICAQAGTSIEMIERHYSHVVPESFADQLSK